MSQKQTLSAFLIGTGFLILVGCGGGSSGGGGNAPNPLETPFDAKASGSFVAEKDTAGNEIQIADTLADKFRKAGCSRESSNGQGAYSIDPTLQVGQMFTWQSYNYMKGTYKNSLIASSSVEFISAQKRAVRMKALQCGTELGGLCGYEYTEEFELTGKNNYRTSITNPNAQALQLMEYYKNQQQQTKSYRTEISGSSLNSTVAGSYTLPYGMIVPALKTTTAWGAVYYLYDSSTQKALGPKSEGSVASQNIWTWVIPQSGSHYGCRTTQLVSLYQIVDKATNQPVQQSMNELLNFK